MRRFERYVAIGDSTTEGLEDPDGQGGYRGWADRFAEHLARELGSLQYANLAVRGLQTRQIRVGQLDDALAMKPDVCTVVSGVNDLIRPGFDAAQVARDQHAMIAALRHAGATVLTFTLPDLSKVMPMARVVRDRQRALNTSLRETCIRTGALLVDIALHDVGGDPRLWHDDRLHANSFGHERVAMGLAHAVGLPGFEGWSAPLPPVPSPSLFELARAELHWSNKYLVPWLLGHVKGERAADGRGAKRPRLAPVTVR